MMIVVCRLKKIISSYIVVHKLSPPDDVDEELMKSSNILG